MIRVCLVDDQTLVRQGIRSLLGLVDDIDVVAQAVDGDEALRVIRESKPDVVLLDVRMPLKSGLEVLQELDATNELPPTIVLTTFDDQPIVLEGIRRGAKGFLLKDVSLDQLVNAIRTLATGGTLIQPAITERIVKSAAQLSNDFTSLEITESFTDREVEVLRLMSGGHSNREIAEALHVAEGTIKNHVSNILSKMGVRDRTRAVLKALEHGYI
ncbi:MAG TPA: response regulator transcription factor [Pyrinomonadaceae bacterium]|jgi:DNA-binding NarL/FixJ family response regulator|nr:response regulator transcription factor [Pyrinomonadaceae bacterium]